MPPPIKRRTTLSYARDVEHLSRLRSAVLLDFTLDPAIRVKTVADIDILTETLSAIIRHLRECDADFLSEKNPPSLAQGGPRLMTAGNHAK